MNMWIKIILLAIGSLHIRKTNSILLHQRLEKGINLYHIQEFSSEIELKRQKGYDERFSLDDIEKENSLLIEIIKINEKYRKLQYLESIKNAPDETKIRVVKDFEEEGDIHTFSMTNGGLLNNWLLDEEIDSSK
jgi:hypothetical protein